MIDIGAVAPPTYIHIKGGVYTHGEEVQPGFLSILDPSDAKIHAPEGLNSTGRRSALAAWLTDPKNPLVARVMVNRVWQYHFGAGIVATPGDFGRMGSRPSHPELLDYLASYFVESGWSVKKLHRLILLSNTYRQSSDSQPAGMQADADNRLLWRYSRRRMEAEAIRDSMLQVSGLLSAEKGGPGVFPPVPAGAVSDLSATAAAGGWKKETDPKMINKRSVYIFVRRNLRYPMLMEFDNANTFEVWHSRKNTVTPAQSLGLLNNDLAVQWSRAFAKRAISEGGISSNMRGAVNRAFLLAYGRPANADEVAMGVAFIEKQAGLLAADKTRKTPGIFERYANTANAPTNEQAEAFADLCQMLFASNEFLYIN
jgi:hypothetical protein